MVESMSLSAREVEPQSLGVVYSLENETKVYLTLKAGDQPTTLSLCQLDYPKLRQCLRSCLYFIGFYFFHFHELTELYFTNWESSKKITHIYQFRTKF